MTATEKASKIAWLSRYREAMEKAQRIKNEIKIAKYNARFAPAINPAAIHVAACGTHSDRTAAAAEKIIRLESELEQVQRYGLEVGTEILNACADLGDCRQLQVLADIYLQGMTAAAVAREMCICESTFYKIKAAGLEALRIT